MTVDLARDTIFVTLAGSHAHGTSHATSDVDVRGVCIAPLETRLSLFRSFEQAEGGPDILAPTVLEKLSAAQPLASSATKIEAVVFDLAKFLGLCAAANPNALEILFADERDWLFETPLWRDIHDRRRLFLSKKVQSTYLGYAMAQLKKIRTHRQWLLTPPPARPTRAEFGLPDESTLSRDDQQRIDQSVADKIRSYGLDSLEIPDPLRAAIVERVSRMMADALRVDEAEVDDAVRGVAVQALRLPPQVVDTLAAERKYRSALRHWDSYETWRATRNPARAELARAHGYDTKHAMHLLRLMHTGLELLETGELSVRRSNAADLLAIRNGALDYDELLEHATYLETRMRAAAATSALPDDVDHDAVDRLAFEALRRWQRPDEDESLSSA
jgi:predicted nucleotidyltransferase